MSANVEATGRIRQLDIRSTADEVVKPEDAADATKLARLLVRILRELVALRRRWWPRRMDFEGLALDNTGTKIFRVQHDLGARVRYWVVEWSGASAPNVRRHSTSTEAIFAFTSTSTGTATLRLEEAG